MIGVNRIEFMRQQRRDLLGMSTGRLSLVKGKGFVKSTNLPRGGDRKRQVPGYGWLVTKGANGIDIMTKNNGSDYSKIPFSRAFWMSSIVGQHKFTVFGLTLEREASFYKSKSSDDEYDDFDGSDNRDKF